MRHLWLTVLLSAAVAGCVGSGSDADDRVVLGKSLTFDHGDLRIAAGDSVTFRMVQGSHTVDFSEGNGDVAGVSQAHSGNLAPGDEFVVTFTQPGTYPYFCQYHSSVSGGERIGMVGTITVT